jgi:hypothetical protein
MGQQMGYHQGCYLAIPMGQCLVLMMGQYFVRRSVYQQGCMLLGDLDGAMLDDADGAADEQKMGQQCNWYHTRVRTLTRDFNFLTL